MRKTYRGWGQPPLQLFFARRDRVFRAGTVNGHAVVLSGGVAHEFDADAGEILDPEISSAHWDQLPHVSEDDVLEHIVFADRDGDRHTAVIVLAGQGLEELSLAHFGGRLTGKDDRLDVRLERNGNAGYLTAEEIGRAAWR